MVWGPMLSPSGLSVLNIFLPTKTLPPKTSFFPAVPLPSASRAPQELAMRHEQGARAPPAAAQLCCLFFVPFIASSSTSLFYNTSNIPGTKTTPNIKSHVICFPSLIILEIHLLIKILLSLSNNTHLSLHKCPEFIDHHCMLYFINCIGE